MGDIHGAHRAMVQVLQRCGFNNETDMLIQLGDVVNRGPETYECVEELLSVKHLIAIKGNHDDIIRSWMVWEEKPAYAMKGKHTKASYQKHGGVPLSHIAFFKQQLPYYKDESSKLFVHGGFDRHLVLDEQTNKDIYWWDRELWNAALSYEALRRGMENNGAGVPGFKIAEPVTEIFIGHTPTLNWNEPLPIHAGPIWNIDTGAGWGGKLTIMDINTKEYWQSDNVNELYTREEMML